MSLKTKRFIAKTEEWIAAHVQKYIINQSKHEITLSVDWDSFGEIDSDENLLKRGVNFKLLEHNIRTLCRDELGKEAFKESVEKVLLRHTDSEEEDDFTYALEGGELIYTTNQKKGKYGDLKGMVAKLENIF